MAYRTDGSGARSVQRRAQGGTNRGALQRRRQTAIAGARQAQLRRDYPVDGRGSRQFRNISSQPELVVARLEQLGLQADPTGGRLSAQPDWNARYLAKVTQSISATGQSRLIEITAHNPGGEGVDVTWTGTIRFYLDNERPAQAETVRSVQEIGGTSTAQTTTGRSASTTTADRQEHTRAMEVHGEASGSRSDSAGATVPVEGVPVEVSSERGSEGSVGGSLSDSRTTEQSSQQVQGATGQHVVTGVSSQRGDLGIDENHLHATIMADISLRAELTREPDPGLLDMPMEYARRAGNAISRLTNPGAQRAHRATVACGTVAWLDTTAYHSAQGS